ncbi:MAG: DUF2064 domain-containing protein [Actinomycetota bacterium]|nr:DUF2064 domain-containing protein [Actinomycetota bacterium]
MAKAPEPGRVKTRLCPPCTPEEAAALAEAALIDTLGAVADAPAAWRVLALDGRPGPWLPAGVDVIVQRGEGLADRLAAAFDDVGAPAIVIGADTPQVTAELLATSLAALMAGGTDAVFGAADDGGYWALGLRRPNRDVFRDVPMSLPTTGVVQRRRLWELGLRVTDLPSLRDVDDFDDACAVAAEIPSSRFAATLTSVMVGP